MRKVLVTAATWFPFELDELKDRPELRVTTDDDDLPLEAYQQSAIEAYEAYTGRILRESTWDLYLDSFPDEIELPAPLSSVTSITYLDTAGVSQAVATTVYTYDTTNEVFGKIVLKYSQSWPSTYTQINVITVRFVAGYASPADIPSRIKDGIAAKVQELYDGQDRRAIYESCWAADARLPI